LSKNFSLVSQHSPYISQPNQKLTPIAISTCTPIDTPLGPVTVPVLVDWTAYGVSNSKRNCAVDIDLRSLQIARVDAIRSIKVDNSFNDVAVYVQATDTLDTVLCPANAVVTSPILTAKNNQLFSVYGEGFFTGRSPKTTIQFTNIPVAGFDLQPGSKYQMIGNIADRRYSNVNGTVFTFLTSEMGTALPDRVVAVLIVAGRFGAGALTLGATLAGVALTSGGAVSAIVSGNTKLLQGFYIPTGPDATLAPLTQASLVVTASATCENMAVYVYTMSNMESPTPFSFGGDNLGLFGTAIAGVDTVPGAYSCWVGFDRTTLTSTDPVFYNATVDADTFDDAEDAHSASAHVYHTASGLYSVGYDPAPQFALADTPLLLGMCWR